MKCLICTETTLPFSQGVVLNKYPVQYYCCSSCGFVQTETPRWLDEAYSSAITQSDIGLVERNLITAAKTECLIQLYFDRGARFVDYGGGYGLFVRLMRDRGFNFYRQDIYCENLFVKNFDAASNSSTNYELLTAFEVFEHLINPMQEIEMMLNYSRNILFSTLLVPNPKPNLNDWWYYGLEHGQHVSLFTLPALQHIANHFNLNLISNGVSLHLLTEYKISSTVFKWVTRAKGAQLINLALRLRSRQKSLLPQDYLALTGKKIE